MHLASGRSLNIFLVNFFNESDHELSKSGRVNQQKKSGRVTG